MEAHRPCGREYASTALITKNKLIRPFKTKSRQGPFCYRSTARGSTFITGTAGQIWHL